MYSEPDYERYYERDAEEGAQPKLGDHGTCGAVHNELGDICGRELTLVQIGLGPVIDGKVVGVAVDWVHTEVVDLGIRIEADGWRDMDIKATDLKMAGHYARLGGPA